MDSPKNEKSSEPVSASKTPRKGRSPAYPSVALDKAIEMARRIYDGQRKQEAHIDSTLHALGYSAQSGTSLRALAALKQYGLTQDIGEGDNRKIKLTDAALDILLLPDSDPRKASGIRSAALAPAIHAALWERYGALLPEGSSILGFLTRDKNYHDEAATDIIENYRTTFALAKLDKTSDTGVNESQKPNTAAPSNFGRHGAQVPAEPKPAERKMNPAIQELPILVGPGMEARIPFPMTEDDFDLLIGTLNLWKKKLVKAPEQNEAKYKDFIHELERRDDMREDMRPQ